MQGLILLFLNLTLSASNRFWLPNGQTVCDTQCRGGSWLINRLECIHCLAILWKQVWVSLAFRWVSPGGAHGAQTFSVMWVYAGNYCSVYLSSPPRCTHGKGWDTVGGRQWNCIAWLRRTIIEQRYFNYSMWNYYKFCNHLLLTEYFHTFLVEKW